MLEIIKTELTSHSFAERQRNTSTCRTALKIRDVVALALTTIPQLEATTAPSSAKSLHEDRQHKQRPITLVNVAGADMVDEVALSTLDIGEDIMVGVVEVAHTADRSRLESSKVLSTADRSQSKFSGMHSTPDRSRLKAHESNGAHSAADRSRLEALEPSRVLSTAAVVDTSAEARRPGSGDPEMRMRTRTWTNKRRSASSETKTTTTTKKMATAWR